MSETNGMGPLPFRLRPDLRVLAVEIDGVLYGPVIEGVVGVCEAQSPREAGDHQTAQSQSEKPAIPCRTSHRNT